MHFLIIQHLYKLITQNIHFIQLSEQKRFEQLIRESDRFPHAKHVDINDTLPPILVSASDRSCEGK